MLVEVLRDEEVPAALLSRLRELVFTSFGDRVTPDDWAHTIGGWRVVASNGDDPVAHAAIVPRELTVGDTAYRTGYLEGVACAPARRGEGIGLTVVAAASELIRREFEMGCLSTGLEGYYERHGWEWWEGPTYVRTSAGLVRTPDEDDGVMVLRFGPSAYLDLEAAISCDERDGDDW